MRRGLAFLAAIVALVAAAPAAHATHIAGATYDGTHDAGGTGSLTVSPDGTQVASFNVTNVPGTVSGGGGTCTINSSSNNTANIPIDPASHSFNQTGSYGSFFRGTFAGPQSVSGTFRVVTPPTSTGQCDTGERSFSATTSASPPPPPPPPPPPTFGPQPGAPPTFEENAQVEQASCRRARRYRGTTSQGERICFTLSRSRRRITQLEFNWRAECDGGSTESLTEVGRRGLPRVGRDGRFRLSSSSFRISGRVSRRAASGTLRIETSGPVGDCDSGRVRWSARRR